MVKCLIARLGAAGERFRTRSLVSRGMMLLEGSSGLELVMVRCRAGPVPLPRAVTRQGRIIAVTEEARRLRVSPDPEPLPLIRHHGAPPQTNTPRRVIRSGNARRRILHPGRSPFLFRDDHPSDEAKKRRKRLLASNWKQLLFVITAEHPAGLRVDQMPVRTQGTPPGRK
jgi:hypothetical protein